jgi:hypothetical protein
MSVQLKGGSSVRLCVCLSVDLLSDIKSFHFQHEIKEKMTSDVP